MLWRGLQEVNKTEIKVGIAQRFLTRRMLRKVASGNYPLIVSADNAKIAESIIGDELKLNEFATHLFAEAKMASGVITNSNMTEGEILDSIMKIFEWIKNNPEFILFILQLFGAV
jgi:hypothetical protein